MALTQSINSISLQFATLKIANKLDDFLAKQLDAQEFEFNEVREDAFQLPSSFIGLVTWFEDNTMVIQIQGRDYNYCGVTHDEFVRFRNSGSKGRYFNNNLRGIKECKN